MWTLGELLPNGWFWEYAFELARELAGLNKLWVELWFPNCMLGENSQCTAWNQLTERSCKLKTPSYRRGCLLCLCMYYCSSLAFIQSVSPKQLILLHLCIKLLDCSPRETQQNAACCISSWVAALSLPVFNPEPHSKTHAGDVFLWRRRILFSY